jgi:predicted dehydrogenase
MDRRHFLVGSAAALGTLGAARVSLSSPNETVRVACVGLRGRGKAHLSAYPKMPNVTVAAICDIDDDVLAGAAKALESHGLPAAKQYKDIRKLLEDKSIDVVSIATPNHHHTLQTIWSCQAGKDVYVEKPCSYNMFEAKQIVAAARRYNRMVQQGTQSRSSVALQEAVKRMRDGELGEVYMARGLCFKWRDTINHTPDGPVPAGVDYDLWLGPAPKRPFSKNRFHYNWHWFWDYGNGDLGNQGIHEVDVARWGLGVRYPTKVSAIGGHFMFDDDQETPNTLNAAYEFDDGGKKKMMEFEVRHWISNNEATISEFDGPPSGLQATAAQAAAQTGNVQTAHAASARAARKTGRNTIGNIFYGSKGYLAVVGSGKYQTWMGPGQEPGPSGNKGGDHFANFIDAVRERKRETLNAEIEEGAISTTLVHLANISYRLGRTIRFDAASYSCPGDEEATRMFTRDYREPFVVPAIDHQASTSASR